MAKQPANRPMYLFLDEGGNFDFSRSGTAYFTLTCLSTMRPFPWFSRLADLRYDFLEGGLDIERFHAAEDTRCVRSAVFGAILQQAGTFQIDAVIVEKSKTGPALQPIVAFYPRMLGYLLQYVLARQVQQGLTRVVIITDALPHEKKRQAIRKAIQQTMAQTIPQGVHYHVFHHRSSSCIGLQVVDYCNWAVYRKWSKGDTQYYKLVQSAIASEFDIFRKGQRHYY